MNIEYCNGGFGRETVYGVVNLGFARALAGIGMGCLIAASLASLKNFSCSVNRKIKFATVSLIEVASALFLTKYFLLGLRYQNRFIVVIVFSALFICFVRKKGMLSRLLDQPIFSALGKYGYSIYVMQQICFYIMQRTLWKTAIINNTFACLEISLLFSVLAGVAVYHLVEKPGYNWYLRHVKYNGTIDG